MPRSRSIAFWLVALVILGLLALPALTRLLAEWWWFQEVGYQVVFRRELLTKVGLFAGVGTVTTLVVYLNLRFAQRGLVPHPRVFTLGEAMPRVNLP
ncbi:MAG: UPF0182 family protein, partial [Gemmatimonadales bacterium]|nr:UPF0182 family protein [Gemmatimonadales bacterium]